MSFDHSTFVSPLSWRYGSKEMRHVWSESEKRRLMRRVWVALAQAQHTAGLVTSAQVADLRSQQDNIDIERAQEIEKETRHDVMAEIRTFAEQCPIGGPIIHWGATSSDITDNVDILRIREAAILLQRRLRTLLGCLADRIDAWAGLATIGHTHIQPAEPTTLGYRFAVYAQDLLENLVALDHLVKRIRGKGFKGAVGTQASYQELLAGSSISPAEMEAEAMAQLQLAYYPIATQTYTRQQDLNIQQLLAGIAASLHKFALDFRVLQSPPFGEWAEPFGEAQVGSSAMPFKRNPVNMETVCSLARYVAALPAVAWDNASQAILERSLDDSANRRLMQAEAFLATEEIIMRAARIVADMVVDETAIRRNLETYGPFAATERLLMALVAAGASRQDGHEWIRESSLKAWSALRLGQRNSLLEHLEADERIARFLPPHEIQTLMDYSAYTGTAAERARAFARTVRQSIEGT
jgi:adenylosuccinate lyase